MIKKLLKDFHRLFRRCSCVNVAPAVIPQKVKSSSERKVASLVSSSSARPQKPLQKRHKTQNGF